MIRYVFFPLTGFALTYFIFSAKAADIPVMERSFHVPALSNQPVDAPAPDIRVVDIDVTAKMEAFNLRNKKLRKGKKRENELELEPLLRLNARIMPDSPVYGRAELEWKRLTKRESGEEPEKQTRLELNQAYVGLTNDIIPHTEVKLGRWLYRDEREWLLDENLDGGLVSWQCGDGSADVFGGRVNFWQKDLMDRTTRNDQSVNIFGLLARYDVADDWVLGAYGVRQHNVSDDSFRQNNFGIRSHNAKHDVFRHWLEIGAAEGHKNGTAIRGYALDMGGTAFFPVDNLNPRLTLGYAVGSKNYRQTGLHSNEATFGGDTKFQIYGETLNPNLTNLQILTLGLGADIGEQSTIELVYHDYSQLTLGELSDDDIDLNPRYDTQSTRRIGYGLDLIYGWEPVDNITLESKLGLFNPSSRFAASSKDNHARSQPAYSAAVDVAVKF